MCPARARTWRSSRRCAWRRACPRRRPRTRADGSPCADTRGCTHMPSARRGRSLALGARIGRGAVVEEKLDHRRRARRRRADECTAVDHGAAPDQDARELDALLASSDSARCLQGGATLAALGREQRRAHHVELCEHRSLVAARYSVREAVRRAKVLVLLGERAPGG